MKIHIYKFLMSIVVIIAPLIVRAQTQDFSEQIEGRWELIPAMQLSQMRNQTGQKINSMEEPRLNMLMSSLKSRKYSFFSDGIFEAYWLLGGNSQFISGRWEVTNTSLLVISTGEGFKIEYRVTWEKGTLVLTPTMESESILKTLYLKKIGK